jgi:hypothetical protein
MIVALVLVMDCSTHFDIPNHQMNAGQSARLPGRNYFRLDSEQRRMGKEASSGSLPDAV